MAGLAQIVWAVAFLRQPTTQMYYAGFALAGGLIVLWGLTRVFPAPFHNSPEAIDIGGIVCKISELVGLGALLVLATQGGVMGLSKQPFPRLAAMALLVAVGGGLLSYGIGRAAEPIFPSLFGAEDSNVDHDHLDGEHSEEHQHEGATEQQP